MKCSKGKFRVLPPQNQDEFGCLLLEQLKKEKVVLFKICKSIRSINKTFSFSQLETLRLQDDTVIAKVEDYRMRKEARIYIHKLTDPSLFNKVMSELLEV